MRLRDVGLVLELRALDAHAGEGVGQEARRPATAVAERLHRHAGRERREIALHVVDAEADVMEALAVLGEPAADRRVLVERLDQLQVGVPGVEIGEQQLQARQLLRCDHAQAEPVAEVAQRRLRVAHGDGNVIEPADHRIV